MIFNSIIFVLFFLLLHFIYWTSAEKHKSRILLIGSFFFYGYWSIPFLLHFVSVIILNYAFYYFSGFVYSKRKIVLIVGFNLVNLGFFKYFDFFIQILNDLFSINLNATANLPAIILPLAISFYTFQIIAFQIDVYRGHIKDKLKLEELLLFIMFFPQLIAGPIMRYDHFFYQLRQRKRYSELAFNSGMILIMIGLVKKVVIADNISAIIDPFFTNPSAYHWTSGFWGIYGFAVQIYCDFAGYTDMAVGMAALLGYNIPVNFRAPYFSTSFREFWQRWHITLSTWLRDYLYIALGGNRVSPVRTEVNLFLTMLLGGIWHGANYNYMIWGAMHGLFLIVERYLKLDKVHTGKLVNIFKMFLIFNLVTFSGLFFRTDSFTKAIDVLNNFFRDGGIHLTNLNKMPTLLFLALLLHMYEYSPEKFRLSFRLRKLLLPVAGFILAIVIATVTSGSSPFIYFQF